MRWMLLLTVLATTASAVELDGHPVQGGMMIGQVEPGAKVTVDGEPVPVSSQGVFVFGIGRDETGERVVRVESSENSAEVVRVPIEPREFDIQRIEGLPQEQVTPPAEVLERIRDDAARVVRARARRDDRVDFLDGFIWPASGPISGVYGSQRVLNGEPRRPHFGIDVAAPTGAPVIAPAAGIITMADPDLYFSGGTIVLDHGLGFTSSFLHLSEVSVATGDVVEQGDLIGRVGATGRATGPHLDWRMNVLDRRIDPGLLVDGDPEQVEIEPGVE